MASGMVYELLDHEKVPADAPDGHPHIIENPRIVSLKGPKIRLADGVATVLWNYKPSALEQFFDMSIERVTFRYTYAHPRVSATHHYVIERTGSEVVVSILHAIFHEFGA